MNITYLIFATPTKPPPKIFNCPSCPHYRSCPTMTQMPIHVVTSWQRWRHLTTVTYYRSILTSHSRFQKVYNPRSKTYLDLEKKMIPNGFYNKSKAYNHKKIPMLPRNHRNPRLGWRESNWRKFFELEP